MSLIEQKPLRVFYAAGPGNVIGTYRHWKEGRPDPSQVNMTISGMFFDICRDYGDTAYVVSSCRTPGKLRDGKFRIVHRPTYFETAGGLLYHFGQTLAALRLILSALLFRADVAVISCGSAHWFPLRVLPALGIAIVPSLHCVMWRKYRKAGIVPYLIQRLNSDLFVTSAHRILSMSHDITAQVDQLTRGRHKPVIEFLPTYERSCFQGLPAPDRHKRPFRVFYAGRIERSKGVFDLLAIAKRFKDEGVDDVVFDICGLGSGFDELQREAAAAGVTDHFLLHGYCNQPVMREKYAACHAVIVPTTTDFVEGFNQVVSEAVLAGRPVITSAVCPAIAYVPSAVMEVPPDDARAYGDAILKLRNDPALYQFKADACLAVQEPFYDESLGWGEALRKALSALRVAGATPQPSTAGATLRRASHLQKATAGAPPQSAPALATSWPAIPRPLPAPVSSVSRP